MSNDDWYWSRVRAIDADRRPGFAARVAQFHADHRANHFEQVDAHGPGLIEEARELGDPVVELGLRVDHLKSRVLRRGEGRSALVDAVALLEFAHRPETAAAPDTVCAVDILVHCYHAIDELGYASERVAASEEALAKIGPSSRCFRCMSGAYICALIDARRFEDALAATEHYREVQREDEQGEPHLSLFAGLAATALTALGRHAEALAEIHAALARGSDLDDHFRVLEALLLARLERPVEAWDMLAAVDARALSPGVACELARTLIVLARGPTASRCDPWLDDLDALHEAALATEQFYYAAFLAHAHALIALERGRPELARQAIARAQPCVERLRSPQRMAAKLARLQTRVLAGPRGRR